MVSDRTRFEILKRDRFRCLYCGAGSEARLEVDHVVPISGGGLDEPSNLATACHRCNSGKSDVHLDVSFLDIVQIRQVARGVLHRDVIDAYIGFSLKDFATFFRPLLRAIPVHEITEILSLPVPDDLPQAEAAEWPLGELFRREGLVQ